MAKTAQDVMKMIKENDIKMVDFKMVDINGQFRHVTIPAQSFNEDIMKEGVGFDASNYGYAVVEKSDMVFIPDPETAMIDPFCEIPTLSMTGNAMIIDYPNNRPLAQYPRNIVLAAEQYMKDTGIADTMLILPEFEFFLFDDVACNVEHNHIAAEIDAEINSIISTQYAKAVEILKGDISKLHLIAKELYNKEKISGEEFAKLMEQAEDNLVIETSEEN